MSVTQPQRAVERDLDAIFTVPRMQSVWKKTVRTGLRRQPLSDLHDFLDVHANLTSYLQALRTEVLSGQYRPQPPEVVLLEKRDGIPRRLCLPSPGDAILLQTLVSVLEAAIAASQPHPNAFYSQSHSGPSIEDVDGTFAYPWWILWPEFQRRIWHFAGTYEYVVVTDLANYFDCIPLGSLRNRIASFGAFNETGLNFLFYLLEAFVWRPFYMPLSGVGVPQLNFDAPRLLAHAYLFPIDNELQSITKGDFVRWMDDINCGVKSVDDARHLLRQLELALNSLGIRLNSAKTRILSAQQATEHFWIQENRTITVLTNICKMAHPGGRVWNALRTYVLKRYRRFRRAGRTGQWDKVCKRYFTLFGLLMDGHLERDVPELLADLPGLRGSICRYYSILGPSPRRLGHLEGFLRSGKCLDDASLFEVVRTFVAWKGQMMGQRRARILSLAPLVAELGSERVGKSKMTVSGVASATWLLAKYGTEGELYRFQSSAATVWTRSAWAARQIAAGTPLLSSSDSSAIRDKIIGSGLTEALRVLASLDQLRSLLSVDRKMRSYLLRAASKGNPYPLQKVIIARVVLHSKIDRATRSKLRANLLSLVSDPCYVSLLRRRQ